MQLVNLTLAVQSLLAVPPIVATPSNLTSLTQVNFTTLHKTLPHLSPSIFPSSTTSRQPATPCRIASHSSHIITFVDRQLTTTSTQRATGFSNRQRHLTTETTTATIQQTYNQVSSTPQPSKNIQARSPDSKQAKWATQPPPSSAPTSP